MPAETHLSVQLCKTKVEPDPCMPESVDQGRNCGIAVHQPPLTGPQKEREEVDRCGLLWRLHAS